MLHFLRLVIETAQTKIDKMELELFRYKVVMWCWILLSLLFTSKWQIPLPIPFIWRINYSSLHTYDLLRDLAVAMFCIVIPAIYIFGLLSFLFRRVSPINEKGSVLILLGASSIAGIPYLHQAFDRADFAHIAQATLPAFIAVAAIASMRFSAMRNRIVCRVGVLSFVTIVLFSWVPSLPAFRLLQMEALHPGSTEAFFIAGKNS